jgi:hypothetical protein
VSDRAEPVAADEAAEPADHDPERPTVLRPPVGRHHPGLGLGQGGPVVPNGEAEGDRRLHVAGLGERRELLRAGNRDHPAAAPPDPADHPGDQLLSGHVGQQHEPQLQQLLQQRPIQLRRQPALTRQATRHRADGEQQP